MKFGFSSVLSKKLLLEATLILTCGLVFSLEIEERINSVRWCRREAADTQLLLATNDKTIKVGNHAFTSFKGCLCYQLWKLKGSQKRSGSAWVGQNVGQVNPIIQQAIW